MPMHFDFDCSNVYCQINVKISIFQSCNGPDHDLTVGQTILSQGQCDTRCIVILPATGDHHPAPRQKIWNTEQLKLSLQDGEFCAITIISCNRCTKNSPKWQSTNFLVLNFIFIFGESIKCKNVSINFIKSSDILEFSDTSK